MASLRLWIQVDFRSLAWRKIVATVMLITAGLFFPLRLAWNMAHVGENCLTHDALCYVPNVEQFYAGAYDANWWHLLRDYTISDASHCVLIPGLIQIFLVPLTDWNLHAELGVGVAFACLKVLLLTVLFGRGQPLLTKSLLFAVMSGLVLSLRHFDSFQFGPAGLFQQTGDLFFLSGIWFLVCGPRYTRTLGMAACGICASLSFGCGMFCWPVYGLGMWLLGIRSWFAYAALLGAGALAATPYWMFRPETPTIVGGQWFSPARIAKGLTHPFFNSGCYEACPVVWILVGGLGIGLAVFLGAVLLRRYWKTERAKLAPAIMVLGYASATLWSITFKRDHFTTWYTVHFAMVWVAIVGMAFLAGESSPPMIRGTFPRGIPTGGAGVPIGVSLLIGILLIPQARPLDKQNVIQLRSRSPASVTAFREFRTAPTHYATFPVAYWQWNHSQTVAYASLLEKRGWSVFGKNRTYLLQGDYGLQSVTLREAQGTLPIMWVKDRKLSPVSFTDYHRLNLFLHAPNAITWEVKIPKETAAAQFESAVAAMKNPQTPESDGAVCQLSLATESGRPETVWTHCVGPRDYDWEGCRLDLTSYAGKTVRLRFGTAPSENVRGDGIVWKCPRIEMQLTKIPPVSHQPIIPSNTCPDYFPPFTKDDVLLDVSTAAWAATVSSIDANGEGQGWQCHGGKTQWEYRRALNVLCEDYPHLLVECSFSKPELAFHSLTVILDCEQNGIVCEHGIIVPLINDPGTHAYCLNLRKCEVDPRLKIVNVTLRPTLGLGDDAAADSRFDRMFQLNQVRFIKRDR